LIGQTLDGMRVWDVRRAVQALHSMHSLEKVPVTVAAENQMAGVALYAALFEPGIGQLDLAALPRTHRNGPHLLNVLQTLDLPMTVAMVAERSSVRLRHATESDWNYPAAVAKQLGWPANRLQFVPE
jgi:hypothetical protein